MGLPLNIRFQWASGFQLLPVRTMTWIKGWPKVRDANGDLLGDCPIARRRNNL